MDITSSEAEALVQRQLDAYNRRDIDALMSTYADDAQQFEHPSKLLASGAAQLRERFVERRKESNLYAQLLNRIVSGGMVVDNEIVNRKFPEGTGKIELIAIYEVQGGKISKAWFRFGAKILNSK